MQRYPIWHVRHTTPYNSLVDVILANRSLTLQNLSDTPDALNDPYLMKDMDRMVARILQAIREGERIVVFGDYDVDGVTSTSVLLDFFDHVGADSTFLLPDRFRDGYGMKPPGVERAIKKGARLIVTSDNGVSSFEAIDAANQAGVDVVVIDHHHPQDRLPDALALVNPNRADCEYPFKGLAAVGVAFKVVQALSQDLISDAGERRRYLNSLLDLVALGTVADVAPMIEENRLLTRRGMQVLEQTERTGLKALKAIAGAANRPVDTTAIGFFLGPRINSAGRLASAELALNLLRSKDFGEASRLAEELDGLNSERKTLQSNGVNEAERQVENEGLDQNKILVLQGADWHLGVVGLIAGRLVDQFWRPALVCTDYRKNGIYTGSARTTGGYNIVEAIFRVADLLTEYGGHAEAAGFSVPAENFPAFRDRLIEDAEAHLSDEDLLPQLEMDVALEPSAISLPTVEAISKLSPFGAGNETPRFMAKNCRIADARAVGHGAHLKLTLDTGLDACDGIWFRQGELVYELSVGDEVDVAFGLEANTWQGRTKVQMMVEDMRPAERLK
ncbi:MAG: single-stranded-DNA-specific exonuclease RecJ [Candidatus Latescibacteria bacterium]|jgi:single-stranded-DNA-specific exonuclease|nr:single-stranded-DNA-specific exonuclease RecJ [Candidatus Latescibacterota bacterium]MBT4139449.1 single-stranded-DNA-specific exonuclease RecJ [Candidatus Latescibacterota bacterium]MBT5832276.1 single-stranded-DNA-specific exonuclease RecJ [Candidatus Latescibacterota bacterium]